MKLGAYALVLLYVALVATVILVVYGIWKNERTLVLTSLGTLGSSVVLLALYRLFAVSARCPLCRGPILSGSGAQRNRHARRFLGSYRLRVARSIILTNTFSCPYCNEPTRCRVKPRSR